MLTKFLSRLVFLTFSLDVEPVHIASSRAAFWWAFLLLMPYHLFGSNPAFRGLAHVCPEWVWGLILLPLALLHQLCLFSEKSWLQVLTLCFALFVWGFVTAFLAQVSQHMPVFGLPWIALNTGVAVYAGKAMDCGRGLLRAGTYLVADVSTWWGRRRKRGRHG